MSEVVSSLQVRARLDYSLDSWKKNPEAQHHGRCGDRSMGLAMFFLQMAGQSVPPTGSKLKSDGMVLPAGGHAQPACRPRQVPPPPPVMMSPKILLGRSVKLFGSRACACRARSTYMWLCNEFPGNSAATNLKDPMQRADGKGHDIGLV